MFVQPLLLTSFSVADTSGYTAPSRARSGEQVSASGETKPESTKDELDISVEAEQAIGKLPPEEQQQIQKLQTRDREVRTHEQAHLATAGRYATGGPSFEYQRGPDGKKYAVGGEVPIDTSPVSGDPEATIEKARVIRAAAQAPADPSSQDQKVAAAATKMESQARQELQSKQQEELLGDPAEQAQGSEYSFTKDNDQSTNSSNVLQFQALATREASRTGRPESAVISAYLAGQTRQPLINLRA